MVLEVSGSAVFLLDAVDGCNFATGLGFGRAECVDGPRASMNKSDSFNSAENSIKGKQKLNLSISKEFYFFNFQVFQLFVNYLF
jgi:hypothetical protein